MAGRKQLFCRADQVPAKACAQATDLSRCSLQPMVFWRTWRPLATASTTRTWLQHHSRGWLLPLEAAVPSQCHVAPLRMAGALQQPTDQSLWLCVSWLHQAHMSRQKAVLPPQADGPLQWVTLDPASQATRKLQRCKVWEGGRATSSWLQSRWRQVLACGPTRGGSGQESRRGPLVPGSEGEVPRSSAALAQTRGQHGESRH